MMQNINLSEIIVPNTSNIQQNALIQRLLKNGMHTLVVGSTGSGKTSVIKNYLLKNKEDATVNLPIIMNFSANTQAGEVQSYLDGKLEKRKRGVFGPPVNKKYLFYVDDLNLPMKEKYGCINSHELVRQMIAHGGWFDLKELYFKQVIDTYCVSAMVQAGGSRNPVTQRLLRHFVVMDFLEMNEAQLNSIFGQILQWWSRKVFDPTTITEEIANKLNSVCDKLVPAAIEIYSAVRSGMLPTPAKMHYTYNLRDLGKLFQGILMINPASICFSQPKEKGAAPVLLDAPECI
nr:dynein heavy chain homolog [Hexamita inflata]